MENGKNERTVRTERTKRTKRTERTERMERMERMKGKSRTGTKQDGQKEKNKVSEVVVKDLS